MRLGVFGPLEKSLGFLLKCFNFVFKDSDLVLQVTFVEFIDVDDVVVSMLADGAPEANAARAVLAKALDVFTAVVIAPEDAPLAGTMLLILHFKNS